MSKEAIKIIFAEDVMQRSALVLAIAFTIIQVGASVAAERNDNSIDDKSVSISRVLVNAVGERHRKGVLVAINAREQIVEIELPKPYTSYQFNRVIGHIERAIYFGAGAKCVLRLDTIYITGERIKGNYECFWSTAIKDFNRNIALQRKAFRAAHMNLVGKLAVN